MTPKPYTQEDFEAILTLCVLDGASPPKIVATMKKYFEGKGWSTHPDDWIRWGVFSDLHVAINTFSETSECSLTTHS